jgi:hypothetical protein
MRPFDYHLVLAYAGPILLVSTILLQVLAAAHARWRWTLPLILAVLMSLPLFDRLSAVEYIRGWVGDFSITTILLLAISTWHGMSARETLEHKDRAAVFICTTVAGLVLYPLTMGIGGWDPYGVGYRPLALLAILLALAVLGRWRGYRAAVFVPIIVLAWWAGLLESTNLWDYLLDPLVAFYGLIWVAVALLRRAFEKRQPEAATATQSEPRP